MGRPLGRKGDQRLLEGVDRLLDRVESDPDDVPPLDELEALALAELAALLQQPEAPTE